MNDNEFNIHYQPLFSVLQLMDVQSLIDQVTDPWYNQTLIQVGDVVVRLGVMQGEFIWHKHDDQDEFSSSSTASSGSSSKTPSRSSCTRARPSRSQPECCTARSSRSAARSSCSRKPE